MTGCAGRHYSADTITVSDGGGGDPSPALDPRCVSCGAVPPPPESATHWGTVITITAVLFVSHYHTADRRGLTSRRQPVGTAPRSSNTDSDRGQIPSLPLPAPLLRHRDPAICHLFSVWSGGAARIIVEICAAEPLCARMPAAHANRRDVFCCHGRPAQQGAGCCALSGPLSGGLVVDLLSTPGGRGFGGLLTPRSVHMSQQVAGAKQSMMGQLNDHRGLQKMRFSDGQRSGSARTLNAP